MYELLLENEGYVLFAAYRLMREHQVLKVKELSGRIGICDKNVKKAFIEWKAAGHHLTFGIDYLIQNGKAYLILTNQFSERELFAHLLRQSSRYQFLDIILRDPIITMRELEKMVYCNRKTIRRRLKDAEPLLATYDITIGQSTQKILIGPELQFRFFAFHLEMLANPSLIHASAKKKFAVAEKIGKLRKSFGCCLRPDMKVQKKTNRDADYLGYKIDDQGYFYVWKQLLDIEHFWLRGTFLRFCQNYIAKDRQLREYGQELYEQIYRLHTYAQLFSGDLLIQVTPHQLLSEDARLINELCLAHLPGYKRLLSKHPELPLCYQAMTDNRLFIERFREKVFSEPYLVKVRTALK